MAAAFPPLEQPMWDWSLLCLWLLMQVSYLSVLRAVGRSTGTQPDQKTRIRQLVSSTILIFLVCFSPYHVFLLLRTLFERDCSFIARIFNYYHVSLLLTSLNCVADPALYCFVSESARRGLHRAIVRPVSRVICCCCRRGNASPVGPAGDSHEVAKDGGQSVTLLTHSYTPLNPKTGSGNATSDPSTVPNKSRAENSGDMGGRTGDRDRKCS
ncbi:ovarian cancer G-protein coupled receptor 1-like [Poecilia latipinna]|uniref:ovarian cancer G-protein coupled receptor 1-like n=1 Tax=Poecilia latipinna TaxID=48699 RepID=UPI00072EA69B|nr:PREDICTED: ovarian cancer G-protein coupled receptor 1-like [Poecilia latipinna]XP_014882925.1 PREDICTED: ovarian cancer G-protein coupled receptor 1-like [Poecilia latipinna]